MRAFRLLFAAVLSACLLPVVAFAAEASGESADASVESQAMYRLYNSWSGEHFYTANAEERDNLVVEGWTYEGIGWKAPVTGDPVYRLYNSYAGDHHYTLDEEERDGLIAGGWTDEEVGWYSDPGETVPLYREYNPNEPKCNHNYTTSKEEHDGLVAIGWHDEKVGWYGTEAGTPASAVADATVDTTEQQESVSADVVENTIQTVYVTKSGKKFHRASCPSTARSKDLIELSREEAIARGYEPCKDCRP